jgi:superoxide reductase
MSKDHYINWIAIFGDDEWVIKWLEPEVDIPYVVFNTEKQNEIYSYCNLHGLWKTNIKVEKEIE